MSVLGMFRRKSVSAAVEQIQEPAIFKAHEGWVSAPQNGHDFGIEGPNRDATTILLFQNGTQNMGGMEIKRHELMGIIMRLSTQLTDQKNQANVSFSTSNGQIALNGLTYGDLSLLRNIAGQHPDARYVHTAKVQHGTAHEHN
jgi:hypothetical protein